VLDGNKKTKDFIIRRELDLKEGDSLLSSGVEPRLLLIRNRIFNTRLFTHVALTLQHDTLFVRMKERYYTYPLPVLGLADRNFNEWWELRHHDPKRINYGINFIKKNVRGRNEILRIKLQSGFSQKAEANYTIPYLTKKQKTGVTASISYISEKKVAYKTSGNILTYTEGAHQLRRRFQSAVTFFRRGKFYNTSLLSVIYNNNHIADTIAQLNSRYFLHGRTSQRYFSLKYTYINDRRDIAYYPLKGHYFSLEAEKLGLLPSDAINQLNFYINYAVFKPLGKNFFLAIGLTQKLSFPKDQPYYNYRSLGYNSYSVSGYELYVIDGQDFSLAKADLKFKLFSRQWSTNLIPLENLRTIPLTVYLKMHSDAGYVADDTYNPENKRFSNKLLWGNGIGLDFVSYYDLVLRVEYSVTRTWQQGIFIHLKAAI
jgi:outer membrane protein assembly factor BamA